MPPHRQVEVEYYRLWFGGYWDTDFIDIPSDAEDLDNAVRISVAKLEWSECPPILVGHYSGPHDEEEDAETAEGDTAGSRDDQPKVPA